MLLNYLYTNFAEEGQFAASVGTSQVHLNELIAAKVFPTASYVYQAKAQTKSIVSNYTDDAIYRFHLRGHAQWFLQIQRLGLNTQDRARQFFFDRYEQAKKAFLTSDLGQDLTEIAPHVTDQFNSDLGNRTWTHFLNGVYGVCTRDGQPETIFMKQAGVFFIEAMTDAGPGHLQPTDLALLRRAVDFLDSVESDFAPHEAPLTSRQRCINDVRTRFLHEAAQ